MNDASAPVHACPGGTYETEPNDNAADANALVGHACGHVGPGDTDDFTFTLPASTRTIGLNYSGGLVVTVTVDGQSVTLAPGIEIPFALGKPYIVEVRAAAGEVDYTIDLNLGT
jgi:hypothetical protein